MADHTVALQPLADVLEPGRKASPHVPAAASGPRVPVQLPSGDAQVHSHRQHMANAEGNSHAAAQEEDRAGKCEREVTVADRVDVVGTHGVVHHMIDMPRIQPAEKGSQTEGRDRNRPEHNQAEYAPNKQKHNCPPLKSAQF